MFVCLWNLHCTEPYHPGADVSGGQALCYAPPPPLIGEHMKDVRLSLVVTKLLWIPLRTSAPNLPNAPSHLWLGGLNLYLLTETPTPSIATGVEYFLYPRGPRL